jgi:hypothetical protein
MEKAALLDLYVDWDHLVFIIQAAASYPKETLSAALAEVCGEAGWALVERVEE